MLVKKLGILLPSRLFKKNIDNSKPINGDLKSTSPHYLIIVTDDQSHKTTISIWINNNSHMFEVNSKYYLFSEKDIDKIRTLIHLSIS